MNDIIALTKIDYIGLFISIFTIMVGIKTIVTVFEWVIDKCGLETKWKRKEKEDHKLLIQTSQDLIKFHKQHNEDIERSDKKDQEIYKELQNITDLFVDNRIDDYRWKILDFCSALSNGRIYNREAFDHIFKVYDKYESILNKRGLKNGLIDESIEFARKKYREHLENGSWK